MVVVSFGHAILTLHLIENPVRFASSLKVSAQRSLAVGGALTAVAVCACVTLLLTRPVPVGHGIAAAPVVSLPQAVAQAGPSAVGARSGVGCGREVDRTSAGANESDSCAGVDREA